MVAIVLLLASNQKLRLHSSVLSIVRLKEWDQMRNDTAFCLMLLAVRLFTHSLLESATVFPRFPAKTVRKLILPFKP